MAKAIGLEHGLSYAAGVARERVHRDAIGEVFVTDVVATDDGLVAAIQLPRAHSYYNDHTLDAEVPDPLLLTEAFRQVGILIAHEKAGAAVGSKFIFETASLRMAPAQALSTNPSVPPQARIVGRIVDSRSRGGEIAGLSLQFSLAFGQTIAATMDVTCQWLPAEVWSTMRGRRRRGLGLDAGADRAHPLEHRLEPAEVARRHPANVVLGSVSTAGCAVDTQIVVDQEHPSLFDHPLDHIPGAVLFEAFRQSGTVACHELLGLSPHYVRLESFDVGFQQFGELELPTDCRVEVTGHAPGSVRCTATISQEGERIAAAELAYAHRAPLTDGTAS